MRANFGVVRDEVFERSEAAGKADQRRCLKGVSAGPKDVGEGGPSVPQALFEPSSRDGHHFDSAGEHGEAKVSSSLNTVIST